MAREGKRDKAKEFFWRKALGRYRQSGLNPTEFCKREGLPREGFYWWRTEIGKRDELRDAAADSNDTFLPLAVLQSTERGHCPREAEVLAELDIEKRVLRIFNCADSNTLLSLLRALKE